MIVCLVFVSSGSFAFSQSKQVKMYLQQIEANAVYMQYLKKAISIARTGLTTIGNIRNGEFKLHDLFFKGLSAVNPTIRNWSKVADIVSYQVNTVKRYKRSYSQLKASGQFTAPELEYIYGVFGKLLDDCADIVLMLADVLSNDTYKMSDDERIRRINLLHAKMQSNYKFCQKFSNNNLIMAMQRLKEQQETIESKKLFDIH